MKLKKYLYILLSLLYLDLIFNLFAYDTYLRSSLFNIILFDMINAGIITLITSIFSAKVNKILTYVISGLLWFWYGLHYIFYSFLLTPFSIALFRQSDQPLQFGGEIIRAIVTNLHILLLFFIPILLLIIFKKKIKFDKVHFKNILIYLGIIIVSIGLFIGNIFIQDKSTGSIYNLYYETNNVSLNIERLGVMSATYLDLKRIIFGFNEKIKAVNYDQDNDNDDELFDYDYNLLDLNFNTGNSIIDNYMENETGTKKNKYTGMFKDKNLIFIVAESFSELGVSEKYTPTLYKLIHEGFYFENFYTSNNLSTIGGEFQALTGLYADNSILSDWRNGVRYFPYGLGTVFKQNGYNTFAFHDHSGYFQDRYVYLKTQGFDNFKACYMGLENLINCEQWPQSDVEMMEATVGDYINSDKPFMTYYMTVSGHMHYDFSGNSIAAKNRNLVNDSGYSEEASAYIATQIELDRAVEVLLNKLEETNKLDDTVIVLLADHYPYDLPLNVINELSSYERDQLIEANSNNLIIYNNKMKSIDVDKVGMSIDVLPTVLNLFGIEYDSRIIMGKDILSTNEGIAIFKDKSWVTNKGVYYASTGRFTASVDSIPDGYVENINNIVNNRVAISRMIVSNDYYRKVFNK